MSDDMSGYTPVMSAGTPVNEPTTQVARDESVEVGRTAADAAGQVAGTAVDQARNVAQEAKVQARDLVGEARGQVQQQARNGQAKVTDGLRALVRELREMAEGGQKSGPASEVARQAADRADQVADWLGEREPGDLIEEMRSFARRRPATFLIGAGVAGAILCRLTRGAVDAARGGTAVIQDGSKPAPERVYDTPNYLTGGPVLPAEPVTGHLEPAYGVDSLTDPLTDPPGAHGQQPGSAAVEDYTENLEDEAGHRRGGLSDEQYRSEYGGAR
jgi:hypothetical protein